MKKLLLISALLFGFNGWAITDYKPYDENANAEEQISDALETAKLNNRYVLLQMGGNWCPDCRIFSGTINMPKVNAYIKMHYKILYIDVKRYEINMQLMEEYGIPSAEGIPRVLVFDKDKNLLNNSNTTEWRTARDRSSQEIFNFFQNMTKD